MSRYRITLLLAAVIISGCASMDSVMSAYEGRSIDDVTAKWGAPDSRINRTDGGATYTWISLSSSQQGVYQCRQTFVTDPSGRIVSGSYAGCPRYFLKR